MFFKNNNQTKIKKYDKVSSESILGRGYTSLKSAKDELHREHISYNPLDYISISKQFFGLNLYTKEPYFLPFQDSTHLLYVGATRSAKGVALAHRAIESIKQNIGLIIIDPKKDDFLSQVILEELERQNRSDDLIIASWPNNFGYSGFNSDDTYLELANKLTVALDLAPTDDPKVDYYRRNERTLLKQICKIFSNSQEFLNIKFELRNCKEITYLLKLPIYRF